MYDNLHCKLLYFELVDYKLLCPSEYLKLLLRCTVEPELLHANHECRHFSISKFSTYIWVICLIMVAEKQAMRCSWYEKTCIYGS